MGEKKVDRRWIAGPLIAGLAVVGLGYLLISGTLEIVKIGPGYHTEKASLDSAYKHQLDSLEKDYRIKLKDLEKKFSLPLGNN